MALLSLVTLFLTQSVFTQWSIARRVSAAFDRSRDLYMRESLFEDLVAGLMPAWPEQQDSAFQGRPERFSAVTLQPLGGGPDSVVSLRLDILGPIGNQSVSARLGDQTLPLLTGVTAARLDYRAIDGSWHLRWPPPNNPGNGVDSGRPVFETPPLPVSVRLTYELAGQRFVWIGNLASTPALPPREQDFAG